MKNRIAFFFLMFLGVSSMSHGQSEVHNGYWWFEKPEGFRLGFAAGYGTAMLHANNISFYHCLAEKNGGTIPEAAPPRDVFESCGREPQTAVYDFGDITVGQLSEGADEFYKTFLNKNVDINFAMRYVRDQLKGKPADELERELAAWRKSLPRK